MAELPDPSTVQVSVDIGSLPSFLSSVVDQLKTSNDRIASLETTITDLTTQLTQTRQQSQEEVEKLQTQLAERTEQLTNLSTRLGELENLDPKTQNEKIADFQSSLANLIDRVGASEKCAAQAQTALTDMRSKIDQLAIRSQETSDQVKSLTHFSTAAQSQLGSHDQRLAETARLIDSLTEVQSQLAEDTANFQKNQKTEFSEKIDRLQAKLSKDLSALKVEVSENAGDKKNISDQNLLNNMVSAAQKAIASAMGAKVARGFQVRVVDVWRQTAGEGAKRRIAARILNRSIARAIDRSYFSSWRDKVSTDRLRAQLENSLVEKIPNSAKILGDFPAKVAAVTGRLDSVEANIEAKFASLEDHLHQAKTEIGQVHDTILSQAQSPVEQFKPLVEAIEGEVKNLSKELGEVKKSVESDCASNKDLQKLMTDVLLLWNSMKQLDATKADRSELERLANEWNFKLADIQRNFGDLVAEREAAAATAAAAAAAKGSGPSVVPQPSPVDQGDLGKLQQQVTSIAQYLFDLVGKLAAMRAIDASKLPVFPSSILPGAFATMPASMPMSTSPIPPPPAMAPTGIDYGGQRGSFGSETANTAELMRYARSLVTAATNGNTRSPSRRELILPADLRLDGAPFRRN